MSGAAALPVKRLPSAIRRAAAVGFFAALGLSGLMAAGGSPTASEVPPRMLLLDAAIVGTDVIAVGERGTILRSADQGRTWHSIPTAARTTFTAIDLAGAASGAVPAHGWIVGHDALILATTDGGRTWLKQYQGEDLQDSFLDVRALDPQHVLAVGAYGLYLETRDGGRTWAKRKLNEDELHYNRLTVAPTGTLYLAGERGTLLRSSDRGATWTRIAAPYEWSFYGLLPLQARTLLAHGLRGHVFRSEDDGATWQQIASPHAVLLATGVKLKTNVILLAGYAGTLLLSRDDARSFAAIESPTKGIAQLVELPGGNVLALGEMGATVMEAPR